MSSWEIFVALSDQNFLLPHRFRIVESPTPARLITSPCYRSTCHVGKYSLQIVSLSDLEYELVFFWRFPLFTLMENFCFKTNFPVLLPYAKMQGLFMNCSEMLKIKLCNAFEQLFVRLINGKFQTVSFCFFIRNWISTKFMSFWNHLTQETKKA